jgi:predicted ATPase
VPGLLAFLQERPMLRILDSCEHLIESLAALAESIFRAALQIHLLAASRESLRVEGEHNHRLFTLEFPPPNAGITAADILAFPAVQLFVERVAASAGGFELADPDAPVVAELCQKLDGIALALELAACRVGAYGIQGTATLLNSRLALLRQGRRTAVPRHQTLSAALGWSYDLLSRTEATVLRRLCVFAGPFALEASLSVAASDDLAQPDVTRRSPASPRNPWHQWTMRAPWCDTACSTRPMPMFRPSSPKVAEGTRLPAARRLFHRPTDAYRARRAR